MNDHDILKLLNSRDEAALALLEQRHGKLCLSVARNILSSEEDAKECVNAALLGVWNAIPPAMPKSLVAFTCGIVRNQARKKLEYRTADKRNDALTVSLTELEEMIGSEDVSLPSSISLSRLISDFLRTEAPDARGMFIRRYYYIDSISTIAQMYHCSQSRVKSSLFRTRIRLREYLIGHGIDLS